MSTSLPTRSDPKCSLVYFIQFTKFLRSFTRRARKRLRAGIESGLKSGAWCVLLHLAREPSVSDIASWNNFITDLRRSFRRDEINHLPNRRNHTWNFGFLGSRLASISSQRSITLRTWFIEYTSSAPASKILHIMGITAVEIIEATKSPSGPSSRSSTGMPSGPGRQYSYRP